MSIAYVGSMETHPTVHRHDADFQITALLDIADHSTSIVDRLMSMPLGDGALDEWDRAVVQRLERKLALRLRQLIEPGEERRSA